ncbi:MAG: hypothetical protein Q9226_003014 [Calogaya cf. arnoldii]
MHSTNPLPHQSLQSRSQVDPQIRNGVEHWLEAQTNAERADQPRKLEPCTPSVSTLAATARQHDITQPSPTPVLPRETTFRHNGTPSSTSSAVRPINLTEEAEADNNDDAMDDAKFDDWLKSKAREHSRAGRYAAYQSASTSRTPKPPTRNLPIIHPFRALASYRQNGILLRPGVCAELQDKRLVMEDRAAEDEVEPYYSFIKIVDIIQDTRSQVVTLRGWVFQRAGCLNGVLVKHRNEVCWIMHVDEDDTRDIKIQAMETVPVEDVIRRRRLILTNQPFPALSFRQDGFSLVESEETIRNERVLVCRFKYINFYVSPDRRGTWSERVLQRLRADDCDKSSATNDTELREIWRGETVPGGAHLRSQLTTFMNAIDLTDGAAGPAPEATMSSTCRRAQSQEREAQVTEIAMRVDWTTNDGLRGYTINGFRPAKRSYGTNDILPPQPKRQQISRSRVGHEQPPPTVSLLYEMRRKCSVHEAKPATKKQALTPKPSTNQYTFNDYFCGAGGMSRAAYENKLHIQDAFDFDKNACYSYQMNFPHSRIQCLWAHEFVNLTIDHKVDIAHLSPPCQFFSDAHTHVGKDDEMNTASWTALGELLTKSKPRVVTLEQTFGIVLRARHQGYLNALIQVFTSHGFSIRWRLLHCADYGLPQMRLRTFMIASCPGEPLPPFPCPTHSSSPEMTGLLPWTTISAALTTIPTNASHHNPHFSTARAVPPRSGDQLANTITCGGGGLVHPSGTRDYTIREFATLQGFGPEHEFGSKGAKKQIGNAVPPIVGSKVLKSVVEALKKEDGISRG